MVKKAYYQMAVFTLLGSVLWVCISIYQSLSGQSEVDVDPTAMEVITPTMDEATLQKITERDRTTQGAAEQLATMTINEVEVAIETATEAAIIQE